jgi:predicted AAA+ superfamily ATPase
VESFAPGAKWAEAPDALGYVELALRSGFPEAALRVPDRSRAAWNDSYVSHLVHLDVFLAGVTPDARRLDAYLEAFAAHSAATVEAKTLYDAAGITRQTAVSYDTTLRRLGTVDLVPAWQSNRLKRLTRAPKRYLTDPALIASLLRVDTSGILRDAALLGAVMDTFVAAQLRSEVALSPLRPRMFHLRDQDGHEVDIVLEYGAGRIAGIEVKAAASVGARDARHLAWLRDQLGDRFTAGVVLHAGALTTELGDRLFAAPISTLWA